MFAILFSSCSNDDVYDYSYKFGANTYFGSELYGDVVDFIQLKTEYAEYATDTTQIKYILTNSGDEPLQCAEGLVYVKKHNKWYCIGPSPHKLTTIQLPWNGSLSMVFSIQKLTEKFVKGTYSIIVQLNDNEGDPYIVIGEFNVK